MADSYEVSNYPSQGRETDYVLLVKCLRLWQNGIRVIKTRRDHKKKLLEYLAIAINYHE